MKLGKLWANAKRDGIGGCIPFHSRLGSVQHRKLPQRGPGRSPGRKQILVHFDLEKTSGPGDDEFDIFVIGWPLPLSLYTSVISDLQLKIPRPSARLPVMGTATNYLLSTNYFLTTSLRK